jgi:hypothetical protein
MSLSLGLLAVVALVCAIGGFLATYDPTVSRAIRDEQRRARALSREGR